MLQDRVRLCGGAALFWTFAAEAGIYRLCGGNTGLLTWWFGLSQRRDGVTRN
jgi:hypothetical protein